MLRCGLCKWYRIETLFVVSSFNILIIAVLEILFLWKVVFEWRICISFVLPKQFHDNRYQNWNVTSIHHHPSSSLSFFLSFYIFIFFFLFIKIFCWNTADIVWNTNLSINQSINQSALSFILSLSFFTCSSLFRFDGHISYSGIHWLLIGENSCNTSSKQFSWNQNAAWLWSDFRIQLICMHCNYIKWNKFTE